MKQFHLDEFLRGWIIGNFEPSIYKKDFEIGIHEWVLGQEDEFHCHKKTDEVNIITNGAVVFEFLNKKEIVCRPKDILVIEKNEYVRLKQVLSNRATIVVIKFISGIPDKYFLESKQI